MTTRKTLALNPEAAAADAPALKNKGRGWEISDSRIDAAQSHLRNGRILAISKNGSLS